MVFVTVWYLKRAECSLVVSLNCKELWPWQVAHIVAWETRTTVSDVLASEARLEDFRPSYTDCISIVELSASRS